eukprot:gene31698-biopygen81599
MVADAEVQGLYTPRGQLAAQVLALWAALSGGRRRTGQCCQWHSEIFRGGSGGTGDPFCPGGGVAARTRPRGPSSRNGESERRSRFGDWRPFAGFDWCRRRSWAEPRKEDEPRQRGAFQFLAMNDE